MDELDSFFESDNAAGDLVKLSHLNNKSSVLCPKSQDITSQYLALQQLDAHQRMIARAKSTVDTSAPRSLQSYLSVADRQKKRSWRKDQGQAREPSFNQDISGPGKDPSLFVDVDDNVSLNASSVNKGIQTGMPFTSFNCITDDKIAWYLDALRHGELLTPSFQGARSQTSAKTNTSRKRIVKGDIMDWHSDSFIRPEKNFSPRILANPTAKSKVKDMRCYNPPFRRKKKSSSSHSSDTFESYENEDEEESADEGSEIQRSSDSSSIEEETQITRPPPSEFDHNLSNPALHGLKPQSYESLRQTPVLSRNEEDKYLNFLSKVTEDILRSGVYSDRAIQQAFEFHMQLYHEEANKEELQSLLAQILEGLKISEDDPDDLPGRSFAAFSPPSTPPERESSDPMPSGEQLTVLSGDALLSLEQLQGDCLQSETAELHSAEAT